MNIFRKHWLYILPIILVVLFVFYDLPNAYFEQDEWHTFGHYIYLNSLGLSEFLRNAFPGRELGHFTPLSLLTKITLFDFFGLNARYFFITSIILHLAVSVAFYSLVYLLTHKKYLATIGAIFFALNSSHHQTVTWLGTFEGVEGATLFGILSLIFFISFERSKKWKFYIFSLICVFLSLLFKEIGFSFLLVLAVLILLSKKIVDKKKLTTYLVLIFALYIAMRLSFTGFVSVSQKPALTSDGSILQTLIYNQLLVPPKLLFQTLIPPDIQKVVLDNFVELTSPISQYVGYPDWFAQKKLSIVLVLGVTILVGSLLFRKIRKNSKIKEIAIFGIIIIIATSIPLLPLKKFVVEIDSRYLYPATLGLVLILISLIEDFKDSFSISKKIFLSLFLVLIGFHAVVLKGNIEQSVQVGEHRKQLLSEIKNLKSTLGEDNLIFAESDKSFFGLAQRKLPFQSGLGQTLLVYYSQYQDIPPSFFTQEFLWNIEDEGYKKYDNFGFGFFWNIENLAKVKNENHLPDQVIHGISYDSENKKIIDITDRVRGEVEGILSAKRQLDKLQISVKSPQNPGDVRLVVDGKRETFWDSKLPYALPQYLDIDLNQKHSIVQVTIDSFDNKDQNEVGYKIDVSENGFDWNEVFSKKRTTLQNGEVSIYLPHISTRYIRIEQIGYHQFAPWVINEIKIYEAID